MSGGYFMHCYAVLVKVRYIRHDEIVAFIGINFLNARIPNNVSFSIDPVQHRPRYLPVHVNQEVEDNHVLKETY